MNVGEHLERIQYLDLIKAKENLTVIHSRILPKVLVKLSDRRHVGSDRLDCAEWQQIGIKTAEWQVLRDEDASKVSWVDVYLVLVTTYEYIVTNRTRTYGGDPAGPASRHVKFPVGVGLGAMGMDASGDGDDEIMSDLQCINPLLAILKQSRTTKSSLSTVNPFQVRCAPPSMVPERMRLPEKMRLLARKQVLPTILAVISSLSPSAKRSAHSFPSGRAVNAEKTISTMQCLVITTLPSKLRVSIASNPRKYLTRAA